MTRKWHVADRLVTTNRHASLLRRLRWRRHDGASVGCRCIRLRCEAAAGGCRGSNRSSSVVLLLDDESPCWGSDHGRRSGLARAAADPRFVSLANMNLTELDIAVFVGALMGGPIVSQSLAKRSAGQSDASNESAVSEHTCEYSEYWKDCWPGAQIQATAVKTTRYCRQRRARA